MSHDHQQKFLETIRQALTDVIPRQNKNILNPEKPGDCQQRLDAMVDKSPEQLLELLELLKQRAESIKLDLVLVNRVDEARESIVGLIKDRSPEYGTKKKVAAWRHPLIDSLDLSPVLANLEIPLVLPPETLMPFEEDWKKLRQQAIESFVGITSADFCVADTATLTMKSRPGQPRSVSLMPVIHVAVIRLEQLVENLTELYFRLHWEPQNQKYSSTNCLTFISGPSKTGDIELVMVHGAHGPREVHLVVITGENVVN